jgi:23S rRNA G2445 N2-methylase RlmL
MEYQFCATCPDEITPLLAREIADLGGKEVRTSYRVVYFTASKEIAYKAHLHLRLANRLYRVLKEIPAQSPNIIFDKARRIRFDQLFSEKQPIGIHVVAANDGGKIPNDLIGSKLREAVNDCFQHHLSVTPNQSSRRGRDRHCRLLSQKSSLGQSGHHL